MHGTAYAPIPGTGPYKIAAASAKQVRYVRNRFFREWSHAAQPDGNPDAIVWRFGLTPEQAVRAVARGEADWTPEVPPSMLPELRTRYASRMHSFASPVTSFVQFNTTLAPFDDVRARRALSLALDRRELVRRYGGRDVASATCQILPPGIPGYRPYCPYTLDPGPAGRWTAPDLKRARRLVAASGTRGQRVILWSWSDDPEITPELARYFVGVLRDLGYRARLKLVTHASLHDPPASVFARIQLIPAAWGDTPQGFFRTWFACDGPNVHGWFCDRRLDRWMRRAQALKATRPRAAAELWARIDRALVDRAAWVPTVNEHFVDLVSARVRNQQGHVYWGLFADQLWLDPQQPEH
jgi:peptide/nickel transport system substrate-binding protein